MSAPDLNRIIARLDDLPTLPRTVLRITELVNDPETSARELGRIISEDPVLTARLLRIVNSSFYGFPQRVATVTGAIVLLGFDAIRNLLLSTAVLDLFAARNRQDRRIQERLWDHSIGCAVGAKSIGRRLRLEKLEELFVAGLLHDIGKIVQMTLLPSAFAEIVRRAEKQQAVGLAEEEAVLGFNHAEVGRLLAERWNLPAQLLAAIGGHHRPAAGEGEPASADIVHVADIFSRALGLGAGLTDPVPPLDRNAWQRLQLRPGAVDAVMAEMLDEFDAMRSFLS